MPAAYYRKTGCIALNAVYRHSRNETQGWDPPAPIPTQVLETPVAEITYQDLDVDGVLVSQSHVDQYLYPGSLPERVNLVLTEPFKGVQFEVSDGRVNGKNERDLYIPKLILPKEPRYIMNSPESCFVAPDSSNNAVRLYMTVRGKQPPTEGRMLFFIKYRTTQ